MSYITIYNIIYVYYIFIHYVLICIDIYDALGNILYVYMHKQISNNNTHLMIYRLHCCAISSK